MTGTHAALLFVAGFAAGGVNAAVGSGTLITFPTLLALGVPPVLANGTNCLGLVPGSAAGAYAFRDLLDRRVLRWAAVVGVSAMAGALMVLVLPSEVFSAAVPWLILLAVGLVGTQPLLMRHLPAPNARTSTIAMTGSGFYGGYFGAGQGIAFLAALAASGVTSIHRANGAKNVLAGVANASAAVVFILGGQVLWWAAAVLAVSSLLGGLLGGRITRRLPAPALRGLVIAVGLVAAVAAFVSGS
ncbi:MAG TPA: sulfite exporter TauE/SafE family protein [Actinomycetota bacterium]|nr:sulfite exporter TauE/SafE family protein [Actinomycetota bacterium]